MSWIPPEPPPMTPRARLARMSMSISYLEGRLVGARETGIDRQEIPHLTDRLRIARDDLLALLSDNEGDPFGDQRAAEVMSRDIETAAGWPTGHEMITQLREALGMFTGAMARSPREVWKETLAEVRARRTEEVMSQD